MLFFFTTLAIGLLHLICIARLLGVVRNSCSRTGSVGGVTAVDVEDVTRDEPGFVRTEEHDAIGAPLREAEPSERNLCRQGRLVLCRAGEAGQHAGVRGAWPDSVDANSRVGDL